MKAVIQRVSGARVSADGQECGTIQRGFLILLGICTGDSESQAKLLASKTANLRVFCDEQDKMNLSLLSVQGEALVVSNFTLCADTSHGRRPSFLNAAPPEIAEPLYRLFCEELRKNGISRVETGSFGAQMSIQASCDGPITILLNTDGWK